MSRLKKSTKLLLILCLSIVLILFSACENDSQPENSQGIFYEVTGGKNQLFLFGSIHYGNEDMYPLDEKVTDAFQQSDVLGFEINLEELDDMEIAEEFVRYGMYDDGRRMTDFVSEEVFLEASQKIERYGIDQNTLDQFQPWYAALLLSDIAIEEAGLSPEYGVENYFQERAEDMEIIGLETIQDQLEPYTKLSEESQAIYLEETLEELDRAEEDLTEMLKSWERGDTSSFADNRAEMLEQAETESLQDYQETMLDNRDTQMTDKLVDLIESDDDKSYFIVVGSLHLAGENSIVDQLEDKGYTLER